MTLSLTKFHSKFDNKTSKTMNFGSFDEFENLLRKMTKVRYYRKEDAPLISPARYESGTTRANKNVLCWDGWAALDIDDWVPDRPLDEAIHDHFGSYRYVVYSTASSTREIPKFRILFELTSSVDKDDIPAFWFALQHLSGNHGDKQVKDLSRMYYVPGDYRTKVNIYSFFFTNSKAPPIDSKELIRKYPMPEKESRNLIDKLPPELQKKIIEHRRAQHTNTDISWTGIHDCPFWPKSMEAEYKAITNTGWYHKMYQIMVAIAGKALEKDYPITPYEIGQLCRELDAETGSWYTDRPLEGEAERAIEYVYRNM